MEEKTEGLLLLSIPYLGAQKILKILTPEQGLLSLIAKRAPLSLTHPFCSAEWIYKKGKESLHLFKDGTLLNDFHELKKAFATLSAAGHIAQLLLRTQLPSKQASGLYALTLAYFGQLSTISDPAPLIASFQVKLLLYEGILALQPECALCQSPALSCKDGESFCLTHGDGGIQFTHQEWETLHTLAYARRFALIRELPLSTAFLAKVALLQKIS